MNKDGLCFFNCQSYFDLGKEVGKYWGDTFNRLHKKDEFAPIVLTYLEAILGDEDCQAKYSPLIENVIRHFPEVIEEIFGMVAGVQESSWEYGKYMDFYSIFALCMGETGDSSCRCSSVVVPPTKTKRTWLLAHTDEDYGRAYPLLAAKVNLKTEKWSGEFLSISHPFQLLGSSAGMTSSFIYQGNSIGYSNHWKSIENNWKKGMIPKTVLTRKLLEASDDLKVTDRGESRHILLDYFCTLPTHNFIVHKDRAESFSILPRWEGDGEPRPSFIPLKKSSVHYHTNHFQEKGYESWQFKEDESSKDSIEMLDYLENSIEDRRWEGDDLFSALKDFVNNNENEKVSDATSAAMVFELGRGINRFWFKPYVGGKEIMGVNVFTG